MGPNDSGIHAYKDTPPQVPLITGVTPKRKQSDTFKETMVDAATAMIKAVADNRATTIVSPQIQQTITQNQEGIWVSPGKAAEIRGKSFSQLGTLKRLFEDGVLTEKEFEEQKSIILSGLKKFSLDDDVLNGFDDIVIGGKRTVTSTI